MNCGIDWLMSGMELVQKYVKTSQKVCPDAYRQLSRQKGAIPSTRQQNNRCSQNCPNESQYCFAHYPMGFYSNHIELHDL